MWKPSTLPHYNIDSTLNSLAFNKQSSVMERWEVLLPYYYIWKKVLTGCQNIQWKIYFFDDFSVLRLSDDVKLHVRETFFNSRYIYVWWNFQSRASTDRFWRPGFDVLMPCGVFTIRIETTIYIESNLWSNCMRARTEHLRTQGPKIYHIDMMRYACKDWGLEDSRTEKYHIDIERTGAHWLARTEDLRTQGPRNIITISSVQGGAYAAWGGFKWTYTSGVFKIPIHLISVCLREVEEALSGHTQI